MADKVFERLGQSKSRHLFCVTTANEALPPTPEAVAAHPTVGAIGVSAETTLADVVSKIRSVGQVGYSARAYILAFDAWFVLSPEILAYKCEQGDCFHFKFVLAEGIVDLSQDWARAVMQPFSYCVLDVDSLRRALEEPLPLPMPIGPATYAKLDRDVAPMFTPSNLYPAEHITGHVTGFMTSRVLPMSENMLQSIWDQAFCNLWLDLVALVDMSGIQINRNVTDHSGASTKATRPDLMLWILNRLCVKFEEKRYVLEEAVVDLQRKLCSLPAHYFGPVKWIIGVALARNQMGVWAMRQGQAPDTLSTKLSMHSPKDKANCLRLSINFLRVALSLTCVYNQLPSLPRPFDALQPCEYGANEQITRTLVITYPEVVKKIEPWSEHVAEGYTTTGYVTRAYAVKASTLVRGEPSIQVDRRGVETFKVVLKPVGYDHMVTDEAELCGALRDVLKALRALHSAGLVHRDVRWKNILRCDDGWMLIDLETVWECGHEPLCSWLLPWDDKVLVEGRYTEQSDLHLVGKLMNRIPHGRLSAAGQEYQSKLLHHEFSTAEEALAGLATWEARKHKYTNGFALRMLGLQC